MRDALAKTRRPRRSAAPPCHAMRSAGHGATFADSWRRAECRLRFPRGEMRRLRNAPGDRPHDHAPAEAYPDLAGGSSSRCAADRVPSGAATHTSAAMWCGCGAPGPLQATGRSRGTPARRAIEIDGISRQTIRGGPGARWQHMEVVGRRRSPSSPRPAAQSSKSSSSPRGALVVARCRNCGA